MKPALLLVCLALVGCATEVSPPIRAADEPTPRERLSVADSDVPPELLLLDGEDTVAAWQGTSCWGNGCFDSVAPRAVDLPEVGPSAVLEAEFALPGSWGISLAQGGRCGHYPVQVESEGERLELTPTGPGGTGVASYFVLAGGGDTSGGWRWEVPERDGVPHAWVRLTQNGPSSGGMADLRVVVDDAAVDGDVGGGVVVRAADGRTTALALDEVDQHCPGDGTVELAVPAGTPDGRIDGLGPAPLDYEVRLDIDGTSHTGTATWSGEGTEHGGDATLTFDRPLPPA